MSATQVILLYFTFTLTRITYAYQCSKCLHSIQCTYMEECPPYCSWICCAGSGYRCQVIHPLVQIPSTSSTYKPSARTTSISTKDNMTSKMPLSLTSIASTIMIGKAVKSNNQSRTVSTHQHNYISQSVYSNTRLITYKTILLETITPTVILDSTKQNIHETLSTMTDLTSVNGLLPEQYECTVLVNITSARYNNGVQMCPCTSYLTRAEFWKTKNFTTEEMLDFMAPLMREVLKELTLDKTRLSTNIRKRTSAPDNRRSSEQIGVVAIAFIIGVVAIVVAIDVVSILRILIF